MEEENDADDHAQTDQELAFAKNFLKVVRMFMQNQAEANQVNITTSTFINNPFVLAINATINNIIFSPNYTLVWTDSPESTESTESTGSEIEARQQSSWESSKGKCLPPCPGWPAKQRYNATHSVEWTFLHGKIYEPLNPRCPVSNGSP